MNPSFSLGLAILAACGAGASCSPAPRQMPPLTAPSITPSAADWEVPGRADPGTTPCSGPFGWVELERWTEAVDLLAGATWKPLTPELARRLGGPALAVEPPPECQPFLLRGVMVLDDSNDDPASPPTGLTVRFDHATVRVAHLALRPFPWERKSAYPVVAWLPISPTEVRPETFVAYSGGVSTR